MQNLPLSGVWRQDIHHTITIVKSSCPMLADRVPGCRLALEFQGRQALSGGVAARAHPTDGGIGMPLSRRLKLSTRTFINSLVVYSTADGKRGDFALWPRADNDLQARTPKTERPDPASPRCFSHTCKPAKTLGHLPVRRALRAEANST